MQRGSFWSIQAVSLLVGLAAVAPVMLLAACFLSLGFHHHVGHHVEHVLSQGAARGGSSNATTHFFKFAVLDHFDGLRGRQFWRQRYYVDQTHWCGDGCPIFLYIGGEGPQGPPSDRLFMGHLAKKMGALMLALEHRYYGESQPVADMSVANLRYLSSSQALADLAKFIEYIRDYSPFKLDLGSTPELKMLSSTKHSKLVAFGGSYPGALAAWLPLKYPASLAGSVASSAPVHAENNFLQYADVTGTAFAARSVGGGPVCKGAIQEAVTALQKLVISTTPAGTDPGIPSALRPCASKQGTPGLHSVLDLATYQSTLFSSFQGTAQYNREEPHGATVASVCAVMTNTSLGAPLLRLAAAQALWEAPPEPNATHPPPPPCVLSSFANDTVAGLVNVTFDGVASGRQWIWQSCNEFGFFQTTTAQYAHTYQASPFVAFTALDIESAGAAVCRAAFGLVEPPATFETNRRYGGRAMLAQNVTIVNGNLDPWHALGIVNATDPYYESCLRDDGEVRPRGDLGCELQRVDRSSRVVLIDSTAHCGDMYAPGLFETARYCPGPSCHPDPPSLVAAHAEIEANVRAYIEGSRHRGEGDERRAAPAERSLAAELAGRDFDARI